MGGATKQRTEAVDSPSAAVLEAVAAAEGCEPTDLNVPLYECVDPDALDAIVSSPLSGRVRFVYHGYELAVDGNGDVTVVGRAPG